MENQPWDGKYRELQHLSCDIGLVVYITKYQYFLSWNVIIKCCIFLKNLRDVIEELGTLMFKWFLIFPLQHLPIVLGIPIMLTIMLTILYESSKFLVPIWWQRAPTPLNTALVKGYLLQSFCKQMCLCSGWKTFVTLVLVGEGILISNSKRCCKFSKTFGWKYRPNAVVFVTLDFFCSLSLYVLNEPRRNQFLLD